MAGFDIDELMSIKNAYQGQRFQWVKPPDKNKLATVVSVTDVIPGKRMNTVNGPVQQYRAVLSDGSSIDTESLTNNLMMLHEDQAPMSIAEVQSIYMDPGLDVVALKETLPADMKAISDLPNVNTPISQLQNLKQSQTQQQIPTQPTERQQISIDTRNLFGMFTVDDSIVNLKLTVQLPAKNLLKMMYSNSGDKDQFVEQLAAHINNSITLDAIKASVQTMMGHDKNKKIDGQ